MDQGSLGVIFWHIRLLSAPRTAGLSTAGVVPVNQRLQEDPFSPHGHRGMVPEGSLHPQCLITSMLLFRYPSQLV